MRVRIVVLIVAVSYFIGRTCGVGVGTATYAILLILYAKISD